MSDLSPMSPRERVIAAFIGDPVDRVPKFDQTVFSAVASAVMGREVLTGGGRLRFTEAVARFNGPAALAEWKDSFFDDYVAFLKHMEYDMVRHPWRERGTPTKKVDEVSYLFGDPDGQWHVCKYNADSDNWHAVDDWMRAAGLIEGMDELQKVLEEADRTYDGPIWSEGAQEWVDDFKRLKSLLPDRAIAADCAHVAISMYDPAWMQLLFAEPELVARAVERQADVACMFIPKMAEAGVDVIFGGGDVALNTGPAYSPELFEEITAPRVRRVRDCAEANGVKVVFKTDGNVWPIAEYMFGKDYGYSHGYSEIDYQAGMRLDELHEKFPELTLIGNVDSSEILSRGTEEQVRVHAQEVLEAGAGHHHIYGISNTVMPETPVENFIAMHEVHAAYRPPQLVAV